MISFYLLLDAFLKLFIHITLKVVKNKVYLLGSNGAGIAGVVLQILLAQLFHGDPADFVDLRFLELKMQVVLERVVVHPHAIHVNELVVDDLSVVLGAIYARLKEKVDRCVL